jgi:phage shock protein E
MFSFLRRPAAPGRLDPDAFRARLTDAAVVLDVRTPAEFAEGHLGGARHVDFLAPDFRHRVEALDRARPYFLYCRTGNRSGQAAEFMRAMGFREVYNVGGLEALARAGFPTER